MRDVVKKMPKDITGARDRVREALKLLSSQYNTTDG
jgi:hypothetical protein